MNEQSIICRGSNRRRQVWEHSFKDSRKIKASKAEKEDIYTSNYISDLTEIQDLTKIKFLFLQ